MKKITLTALLISTGLAALAQSTTSPTPTPVPTKMQLGFDVGVNLARLNVDRGSFPSTTGLADPSNKVAYHGAIFLNIPIGGVFSLKPQVMYSRQGSKFATTQNGTTNNYSEDLNYIYVAPAALHILTKSGFLIETGPQLGFLVHGKLDGGTFNDVDITKNRNPLDFLWSAGVGYMIPSGFGIHARYNYGFSNVLNAKEAVNQSAGKMQNRLIQIGLMYHLGGHGGHGKH
ncbi:MAG: hypothetical protein JWQ40_4580 [Segetibacter sp.]|jgi:hypothetical protein|nr:hypothetical protein [Segetibacter sp.]